MSQKGSQKGSKRRPVRVTKGPRMIPEGPRRDHQQKQDFQSRIPYCDFHDFARDSYQNAPNVKILWQFLHKMGQNLRMGQTEENGAKVENVKNLRKWRMSLKPLWFLHKWGKSWENENCPIFWKWGLLRIKCPIIWDQRGLEFLTFCHRKSFWGGWEN